MFHSNLYPISVLEVGFYFFTYTCFRIRISSPIHLDILTMPILNLNCLKNAKIFGQSQRKKVSLQLVHLSTIKALENFF